MHFPVLVVLKPHEKLDDVMYPFYLYLESEPYIVKTKSELLKEAKSRKEWLKTVLEHDPEAVLSDFDKELFKTKTDEELYQVYREDAFYDYDEEGNRLASHNPNGRWSQWEIGGRFSGQLLTTEGQYLNSCTFDKLDSADNDETYYETLKWWYDNIENAKNDTANQLKEIYGSGDVYARMKSKLYFDHVLKDGKWYELGIDESSEIKWAENFYKRFLAECKETDILIVLDCHY